MSGHGSISEAVVVDLADDTHYGNVIRRKEVRFWHVSAEGFSIVQSCRATHLRSDTLTFPPPHLHQQAEA
ncbi:hypothetical protein HYQ46_013318 [Verticillium longisporum]|nr:hypothetical protein HYQ46_013318 [Verticillium longisporum]